MKDFEYLLMCFLVPVAYVMTYIAGKYDLLSILCKMLEEKEEKIEEDKHEAD